MLEPGVWTSQVPRLLAYKLHRQGMVDLELPQDPEAYQDLPAFYWLSPFSMGDGYATAAEHLLHAAIRAGGKPAVEACWFYVERGLLPETLQLLETGPDLSELYLVGICMATPGEFKKLSTPYRVGITMYESTNPLEVHPEWRHECNAVDLLLLPSEWCREVFSAFARVPMDVVPLAINPMYCVGEHIKRKPKRNFTFFQFAALTGRKAPLETLEAFRKAFPLVQYPDVRMVFKTRAGAFGWTEGIAPTFEDPRVEYYDEDWLPEHLFAYLRDRADCMVFPSRGEGFGLPPREAIAMGVPTILTRSSGMLDVCDTQYNWPLEVKRLSASILGGEWDEPDWDQLVDVMRWIYGNQSKAFDKARRGARWFRLQHGPDAAGKQLMTALRAADPVSNVAWSDSQGPTPKTRRELDELRAVHEPFYTLVQQHTQPGARLLLFGVEEGVALAHLLERGYDAFGVTDDPERLEVTRETLRGCDRDPGRVRSVPSLLDYRSASNSIDACVSMSILEHYERQAVHRLIDRQLEAAPKVLLSVPTAYLEQPHLPDGRLHRAAQWYDILMPFELAYIGHYSRKAYLAACVTARDETRGYMIRTLGYEKNGVWRPFTDAGERERRLVHDG